jgi:hypothetical protein
MRHFDHDFVRDLLVRLGGISPAERPRWGSLTRDRLIGHLAAALRYSMGRAGKAPRRDTWLIRRVVAPLFLSGILRMPRNLKSPFEHLENKGVSTGDLETLHALLEDYLRLAETGELSPEPHPVFGDIGVDGWARLHVLHFEHHLRQFGV